jgi:phenylalanyl-tRNA synthetase beta chain
MKFTLGWLKDHLDTQADLTQLVDAMTRIGLEVETVDDPSQALRPFTIAAVIEAKPHPNADRLRVCLVDTGSGEHVQVVCGAPNARSGMKSVFSPPGTYIPGKRITLGKGVIRGVESNGMLCSPAELMVSDDHDGIIDLPDDAPIGARYIDYAGLTDPLIEINLTPNRPDAASVHGIARDLAAAGLGTLKDRPVHPVPGQFACPVSVELAFDHTDRHLCPAFALRLVRGVRNGPSPDWLQKRLRAIGLRPINALVDITNYLTFDRGRPLHVFDAAKVHGNLQVRRAREGEEILALDGRSYRPGPGTVVISDESGLESIAGIMGGEQSGCDEDTQNVLIESALWDPVNIAQSGRALNINSDARYRFERGVDPAFCLPGIELAIHFVLEFCGGTPSEVVVAGQPPMPQRRIDFPFSEVVRLTGLALPPAEMQTILEALGFRLTMKDAELATVLVPSWRPDIEGKADIVEEVVRIAGLDRVAATPLPRLEAKVAKPVLSLLQRRTRLAKRALAARGLVEAVTWSFIGKSAAAAFGGGDQRLMLANPIAADLSDMRPSLLPGLLAAAQRNADRGIGDVALFEVGQIFLGDGDTDQRIAAAGVRRLTAKTYGSGRNWSGKRADVDAFDAKADALGLLSALAVPLAGLQVVAGGPDWFHPGRSGSLQFGPKVRLGTFGEFHPDVLDLLGVEGPLCGFELVLDLLPEPKVKTTKAKPKLDLPELMPLERDFAFVVDRSVSAADLLRDVQAADRQLIATASIFDVYEGPGIPAGKKSVAVSVVLQPREKTLTDAEIEALMGRVIAEVGRKTGASLRV